MDTQDGQRPDRNALFRLQEGERGYTVYVAPEGQDDGEFVPVEGGFVWVSEAFPNGQPCRVKTLFKGDGDMLLNQIQGETDARGGWMRRR